MSSGASWPTQGIYTPSHLEFTVGPRQPFASPFGVSVTLSGKWACGQNSTCPMGWVSKGLAWPHAQSRSKRWFSLLQTDGPNKVRRPRTMALGSPIIIWPRYGQVSAGWGPGRGSCGSS